MTKINIFGIIKAHWRSQFQSLWDYLIFLLFPAIIGILLARFGLTLEHELETTISSLSIFIGLFINVMVLLFDIVKRDRKRSLKVQVVKELIANISFTILISGIAILTLFATKFDEPCVKCIFNSLSFSLLTWIALNVLMILKRIYKLFTDQIEEIVRKNEPENSSKNEDSENDGSDTKK